MTLPRGFPLTEGPWVRVLCSQGLLQVASVPGAGWTLRSLGTGVVWFHLLYSVVVNVDFFFPSLHKKVKYLLLLSRSTLSREDCLCV